MKKINWSLILSVFSIFLNLVLFAWIIIGGLGGITLSPARVLLERKDGKRYSQIELSTSTGWPTFLLFSNETGSDKEGAVSFTAYPGLAEGRLISKQVIGEPQASRVEVELTTQKISASKTGIRKESPAILLEVKTGDKVRQWQTGSLD